MATAETTTATLRIPPGPFRNEPPTDFTHAENARRMREALAKVGAELGREYDMVIGNRLIKTEHKITSVNPALPSQVVGVTQEAGREYVEAAVQAAAGALRSGKTPASKNGPSCSPAWRQFCASANSNFPLGWSTKWERIGPRRMPTLQKRLILPSTMRARRNA